MQITINKLLTILIVISSYIFSAPFPQTAYASNGLNVIISPNPLPAQGQGSFVGSQKCAACHETIYKHWIATSPHVKAWNTLKTKQAEVKTSCLRCHTTGYGVKSGFSDFKQTPHLAGVQCESCHGPASKHLAKKSGWSWISANCATCQTRKICMGCHTVTHSPNFELKSYLEKIKHPK